MYDLTVRDFFLRKVSIPIYISGAHCNISAFILHWGVYNYQSTFHGFFKLLIRAMSTCPQHKDVYKIFRLCITILRCDPQTWPFFQYPVILSSVYRISLPGQNQKLN